MLRTKIVKAETRVLDEARGKIHAVVSTEARDREGDIIRVSGWELTNFMKHPILLSSHDYRQLRAQIGEWESMEVKGKRLEGVARYYVGEGNQEADWGFNLAAKGMAAYSVGFIPDMDKAEPLDGGRGLFGSFEFKGQELLEVSHVTVPANPHALQQLKSVDLEPAVAEIVDRILRENLTNDTDDSDDSNIALIREPLPIPTLQVLVDRLIDEFQRRGFELLEMSPSLKPLPNEHACRLRDPGDFQEGSFRRMRREHEGKQYSVIMGRLKGETTLTEQAYRYPKETWSAAQARSHCRSHDGDFEAAERAIILQLSKPDPSGLSLGAAIRQGMDEALEKHYQEVNQ